MTIRFIWKRCGGDICLALGSIVTTLFFGVVIGIWVANLFLGAK